MAQSDLLHSESGNVSTILLVDNAERKGHVGRVSCTQPFVCGWSKNELASWVANVTERHMLVFGQDEARSGGRCSQTFTDSRDCFDRSFFGNKTVGRPVGVRS